MAWSGRPGWGLATARHALGSTAGTAVRLTQGVAFWVGVGLPAVYLPLILWGVAPIDAGTLVALVSVNYLALVAGRGYRDPTGTRD